MTTEPTDWREKIARALYVGKWAGMMSDPSSSYDHPNNEDAREMCRDAADAVLPIVREAQADALRGAADDMGKWGEEGLIVTGDDDDMSTWVEVSIREWLNDRADEIERSTDDE